MQQLSNARNHSENLGEAVRPINSQRPESSSEASLCRSIAEAFRGHDEMRLLLPRILGNSFLIRWRR
jgi:hypothetical protein